MELKKGPFGKCHFESACLKCKHMHGTAEFGTRILTTCMDSGHPVLGQELKACDSRATCTRMLCGLEKVFLCSRFASGLPQALPD